MNVIVSNLNADKFNDLNIDVIKSISGEYSADEIVQTFSNFFFNRMFLDITSVQNYADVNVFRKISMGLDTSKIILLLSNEPIVNSDSYISSLISMGIYNFARTVEELKYLYDNPNSYKDVAHLQIINTNTVSYNPNNIVDNSGIRNNSCVIIGFKNYTLHAGATSLIYMLKKILSKNYSVVAIEVDPNMLSCMSSELGDVINRNSNVNIILVDLNDGAGGENLCNDVIYLMESSTLMINRLFMLDNRCFDRMRGRKIVLNKSLLDNEDIKLLQKESGITFFSILPNLNDRLINEDVLYPFLESLGLYRRSN